MSCQKLSQAVISCQIGTKQGENQFEMVRQTHRQNLSAGVELRFAAKNHFSVTNVKGGEGGWV